MTIEWGPDRPHDGSAECPAEARDVPCMVLGGGRWQGRIGDNVGTGWYWQGVTAYRLPADVPAPAPAADPVRDALMEALEFYGEPDFYISFEGEDSTITCDGGSKARAALALAKGETK